MTSIISTSTSAFYDRSIMDMGSLRSQAESLQEQLSRGSKLARSSDDPVAASRLRMLARSDSLAKIDTVNASRATADLTLADSALGTFADYVMRAKELASQAANGTITDTQRASAGNELKMMYDSLVSLANSRDSAGHALFGGEASGDAYTLDSSGNAVYAGTASSGELPLGDGQSITRGLTGPQILNFSVGGSATNLLAVIKGLGDALTTGTTPQASANQALGALETGLDAITTAQTVVGTRLNWIDLTGERRTNLGELRTSEQEEIGATDIPGTMANLSQILTVLEASQASFSKLAGLSLFNMIR